MTKNKPRKPKKITRSQMQRMVQHLKDAMKPMPGQTLTFIDKDGVHHVKV